MANTYTSKTAKNWDYFIDETETSSDIAHYIKLLKPKSESQLVKTLNIGCGTGQFALQLHKEKHDVLAVDSCEFMLSVFRNKLGEGSGPRIIHADFETFATQETFDGIVALNATQFLLNANQVKDFFQKVHGLLGNGGVFLFTAPNPLAQWEPSGWSAVVSREFENGFARREASFQPVNKLKGLVKVSDYKVLCVGDNCSIDYYSKMIRLYTLTEYKLLLHQAGFNNIAINVDQDQGVSQLSKDALKMYISATK